MEQKFQNPALLEAWLVSGLGDSSAGDVPAMQAWAL